MKIPFTLDAWLKDKSQKIETAFGEPAKVVFTEGLGECPILAVIYDGDTTDSAWFTKDGRSQDGVYGLFIVTPEPEFTEFEKKLWEVLKSEGSPIDPIEKFTNSDKEVFHSYAAKLLSLARDQFIKDGYILEKKAFHDAVEKVAPEVMKDVSDKVDMEEALRLEYERGKTDALKDLPRWKKCGPDTGQIILYKGFCNEQNCLYVGGYKIMLSDLEKLPKDE